MSAGLASARVDVDDDDDDDEEEDFMSTALKHRQMKPLEQQEGGLSEQSESDESDIPRTASWTTAGLLMIADVVGAGVMSLATAFAQLGWLFSIVSLIVWYMVAMYVGVLVSVSREAWPQSQSFTQLAENNFGHRFKIVTGTAIYSFLAFVLGDYMLIIGEAIKMMFYDVQVCSPVWTLLGALFLLPLTQFRLLAMTSWLMVVNIFTILASISITIGVLTNMSKEEMIEFRGQNETIYTELIASNLTVISFFRSQALFAFAYMGVFVYLEIISEMKEPKDFKKSLLFLSGPFQVSVYGLAGGMGYKLIGTKAEGLLIKQIPPGNWYRLSAFLLAVHIMLTFIVKGTILSRAVHSFVDPNSAKDFSHPSANRVYLLVSVGLLVFCLVIANLIPFFDDLTSFLGALQTPFIGFILPILFAFKARRKLGGRTGLVELLIMILIVVFMILLFFFGVVGSLLRIAENWARDASPLVSCFT